MFVRLREINREAKRHGDEEEIVEDNFDFEGIKRFIKQMGPLACIPVWGVSTALLSIHSILKS